MRSGKVSQLAIATLFMTVGLADAIAQQDQGDVETIFFVELAGEATLADGVLSLRDVDETVLWFSDRPFRDTGSVDLARLVEAWDEGEDSFADNPPNAVLSGMSDEGEVAIVVELMAPRYEVGILSFSYLALSDDVPQSLSNVSLFIDGGDGPFFF